MTAPATIPPAAISFAADTLAMELGGDTVHLLTVYGTTDDRVAIGAAELAPAGRPAALPAMLRGRAARSSHGHSLHMPVVGYGIATPRDGRILLTDRHARILTLTTTDGPAACTDHDTAIAQALISLIAAGPGIHTPTAILPAATRARSHRLPIPVRSSRLGESAVFAPSWGYACDPHFRWYIRGAYTGVLRSGTAFACTRAVADAIVADHQRMRTDHGEDLRLRGYRGDHLTAALDQRIRTIGWDGDEIVVDTRALTGNARDLHRIRPCPDGSYLVSATTGTWVAVDRDVCDHIDGHPTR